jgi:hypothetical protein
MPIRTAGGKLFVLATMRTYDGAAALDLIIGERWALVVVRELPGFEV